MQEVLSTLESTYIRQADAEDYINVKARDIAIGLQALDQKKQELQQMYKQLHELEIDVCDKSEIIEANKSVVMGMGIR